MPKLLFVDDDRTIRELWSEILGKEGFEVKTASTVAESLRLITSEKFDVVISDLNIGEPSDGFTVVSAARRVQPDAVTLILTGYPAFQAALRAIQEQVDDFFTKPAEIQHVLDSIRRNALRRERWRSVHTKRLPQIITEYRQEIIEHWHKEVENHPEIQRVRLSRHDRLDHLPDLLDELVQSVTIEASTSDQAYSSARKHGAKRREQGYTLGMLLEETRILHHVISDCAQKNLLSIDLSNMLPDLVQVDDRLQRMLRYSLETFFGINKAMQRERANS
jgi:ActR/RegA family two-component response regulator